jgi:putative selenium metabolism protein SsnA
LAIVFPKGGAMKRLIEGATVWDGAGRLVEDGTILIEGGTIEAVLDRAGRSGLRLPSQVERVDASGRLAIPGLINAHAHLYSSLARGMSVPGFSPTSFAGILEGLWWKLDKALDSESIRASALVGAMEAARSGVTTLVDHHASPRAVPGSLRLLEEAVCDEVGLRGSFAYEVSDRDGPEIASQGIEENASFLSGHRNGDGRVSGLFGLHASFTLSDGTLRRVAERLPEKVGVHIHVAEGPEDEADAERTHGMRVIERLDRFGLLRPSSVLAHCLHLDEAEKDLVAERGAIVVTNPRSNMNNAVGAFDLPGFLGRGVLTGLGTDGLGANLLTELFTASILEKHERADPRAGGFDALYRILFRNNPAIVERVLGIRVGEIAAGAPADLALLDYAPPTPLVAENVLGHLLFGIAVHDLHVSHLFVGGRPVLRDGRFLDLDQEAIYAHARDAAQKLWRRLA